MKLGHLIIVITLFLTATIVIFLRATTAQPIPEVKVTADQALTIIKGSDKTYNRIINGSSQSTELRCVSPNWIKYLKNMGNEDHARIYVSTTPFNEIRQYWVISYETTWDHGWSSGSGKYVVDAETGELMISLETQSHLPVSHPPDTPIEYTYGLESDITSAAKQWGNPWTTSLLQPTWSPEGMNQTAVYVQNSNVTTHTGTITQVTTLYSYKGIHDPWTAEIQLRALMSWDMGWMVPRPDMNMGIEGNYTTINGYPAYVGVIGWFEGGYYDLYGGSARVVSVLVGHVLYLFRAPENIPSSDLIKMVSSLKPV